VQHSDPAQHRRLLAAINEDGGDGGVFFLAVGLVRDGPFRVVSLLCARPSAAAAAGPWYACMIRAVQPSDPAAAWTGSAESVVLEMAPVPSSASTREKPVISVNIEQEVKVDGN
jgi:hypothetical protein